MPHTPRTRRRPTPRGGAPRGRVTRLEGVRLTSLRRLRIGFILIAMVVSVFGARLLQLQGVDAAAYAAQARALGAVTEELPATRGAILDRNGVAMAESLDGLMIVADPTKTVTNAPRVAQLLSDRLDLDYIQTVKVLSDAEREDGTANRFGYVARRIPSEQARAALKELEDLGIEKGIDTRWDPVRSYPGKDVGANLLGFTNRLGQAGGGLEMVYDSLLAGKDGHATYDVGGGNRIPLGDNSRVEPQDGEDLTLTIDRDVQFYAQRVLREAVQSARAASGSVVAMDTRTGELLAVADYPSYDANGDYFDKSDHLGSGAFRDLYEPGSVQKVLTAAALVDAGHVDPLTRITVPEKLASSDRVIGDYFDHGLLRLTMTGVIAKSSNIGTALAAREMPARKLYRYLQAFGEGRRVAIEGFGGSAGLLSPWSDWIQVERDNIAFGQGLAVSAVQMTAAVNAIARGGEYVAPSLVRGRVVDTQGRVTGSAVASTHRVVSAEAARATAQMMEMVTDQSQGTAGSAAIPGYRVAGKTGTAQRVDPRCGCYGRQFTVSFAGFAPADDPRFTLYVVVHKPRNGAGGGATGGPVFRKVMGYLLQKYAVPPTGAPPVRIPTEWVPGTGPEGAEEKADLQERFGDDGGPAGGAAAGLGLR
jgi:cell division protein FtsI (penicillin-binding protein 3)